MKKPLFLLLAVLAGILVTVSIVQWQKHDAQKAEITSLRGEIERKTREIADAQAQQKRAEIQKREFLEQASDLAGKLQSQRVASAQAEAKAAKALAASRSRPPGMGQRGFGAAMAKMMEDPEMMKVIREQQRVKMDSLYSPLVKKVNLTPEEANQFKDLLANNMMSGATKATSLFGANSSTKRTEALRALNAEQKDIEQQIREFLGESRYAEYQDYQQTVAERMQLNQFRLQNAGGEGALTDQQVEQLLGVMKEEKQAVTAATGQAFPVAGQDASNLEAMFSKEGAEKLLQAQETISQRVYDRARDILSPDQLVSFCSFQTNQLQMMRMGINMARKLMVSEGSENASQASP